MQANGIVTFSTPVCVTISYAGVLPEGGDPSELTFAVSDDGGATWRQLEDFTLDPISQTVSININYLASFAVYSNVEAPVLELSLTDMIISPARIDTGDVVTISITVTNLDSTPVTETIALLLDGNTIDSREVSLNAAETRNISFTITAGSTGHYSVTIGPLEGSFTVEKLSPREGEIFLWYQWLAIMISLLVLELIILITRPWRLFGRKRDEDVD